MDVTQLLSELNPDQRVAVTHTEGPIIVIAGAGTGKTRVITYRIAYLINTGTAHPREILATTFTDKAAEEMTTRVDQLVPYGYVETTISTFHSFGELILRDYAWELGIDPNFRVLNEYEVALFLSDHLFELPLQRFRPLSRPTHYLRDLIDYISRLKDEDIAPEEYLTYAENLPPDDPERDKHLELAHFYEKYETLLLQHSYVDIQHLISLPLKLFRQYPDVLKEFQSRYRFVLVDEFQDTNFAQWQLLKLIVAGHRNIMVVGDDDQSIYKFRGAAISNILTFSKEFPDAKKVVLRQNYRSTPTILNAACRLIRNNQKRLESIYPDIDKRINSIRDDLPNSIGYHFFPTSSAEAEYIVELIQQLVNSGTYNYKDIAILVRRNESAEDIINVLNNRGILYHFTGSEGLFDQPEIKTLINLMRLTHSPADVGAIYAILTSPIYELSDNVSGTEIATVMAHLNSYEGESKLDALNDIDKLDSLNTATKSIVKKIHNDIKLFLDLAVKEPAPFAIYQFLKSSGWFERIERNPTPQMIQSMNNIMAFLKLLESMGRDTGDTRAFYLVDRLDKLRDMGENPPLPEPDFEEDAVNILTLHKAKGLEFKVVIMPALVDEVFPGRKRRRFTEVPDALLKEEIIVSDELEEERRLFYVGMTRAMDKLIMTWPRKYKDRRRQKKVSPFVMEALDLPPDVLEASYTADEDIVSHYEPLPGVPLIQMKLPKFLSAAQIGDYKLCPRRYYFRYVLKLPPEPDHNLVYGEAIHEAIAYYLRFKKKRIIPALEDVFNVFESVWRTRKGYFHSPEHERMRFEHGKSVLLRFMEEEKDAPPPVFIEEAFRVTVEGILINGRWDRIDWHNEGGVIIDYKTGDVKDEATAKRKLRENWQLPIYVLAFYERFGVLPNKVMLKFVDTGVEASLKKIEDSKTKAVEVIKEVWDKIRKGEFDPTPQYMACDHCPYRRYCKYRG